MKAENQGGKIADNQKNFELLQEDRRRQRTRTLLLYEAYRESFAEGYPVLAYRIGDGFYYEVKGRRPLLPAEIARLKETMLRKSRENKPLHPLELTRDQAISRISISGMERTKRWLEDCENYLPAFYESTNGLLAFKGRLSDSTGDAGTWDLIPYPPGILMRVALPGEDKLPFYLERPTLFRTFFEAAQWGSIHGASFISDVNARVKNSEIHEFIHVSEALHSRKIARIADQIFMMQPRPSVILISGPSSSGKTSFARLLLIQLKVLGLKPVTLSLDNYYLPREQVPLDQDGNPDYEVLEAIDISLFNEDLLRLAAGEEICPPVLDFETHTRNKGKPLRLAQNGILIVEGIHGLNPGLTPHLTAPSVFKVFVSALNHLNFDLLSRISTTDLRLIRRIIRDKLTRGYSAAETLNRWESVRQGEERYIFPYQEEANVMFNSALPYELNVLKPFALKVLEEKMNGNTRSEAERLLQMLDAVVPLEIDRTGKDIPPTSIIREFIGGSALVN